MKSRQVDQGLSSPPSPTFRPELHPSLLPLPLGGDPPSWGTQGAAVHVQLPVPIQSDGPQSGPQQLPSAALAGAQQPRQPSCSLLQLGLHRPELVLPEGCGRRSRASHAQPTRAVCLSEPQPHLQHGQALCLPDGPHTSAWPRFPRCPAGHSPQALPTCFHHGCQTLTPPVPAGHRHSRLSPLQLHSPSPPHR